MKKREMKVMMVKARLVAPNAWNVPEILVCLGNVDIMSERERGTEAGCFICSRRKEVSALDRT